MENFTLKLVVIGLIILLAAVISAFMWLVIRYGKKSVRNAELFGMMEEDSRQQERIISLLKSGREAQKFER
jgi:hypothetical protein